MKKRVLVIVMDGLRPDTISRETMPFLCDLMDSGIRFESNYASFPSKTRIASAVLSTGCYPGRNGLMNNGMYLPELGEINTKHRDDLERLHLSSQGPILAVPTLAERLTKSGLKVALCTGFSTGGTFLQDPNGFAECTVNHSFIHPEELKPVLRERFGDAPGQVVPDVGRNEYAVRVLTEYILPEVDPDYAVLWLSEPDLAQHKYPIGSQTVMEALRLVDGWVKRVVEALEDLGMLGSTDLFLLSDHGFIDKDFAVESLTENTKAWLQQEKGLDAVVVNFNSIYIRSGKNEALRQIIDFLQQQPEIGPIFAQRPLDGVIPYALLNLEHDRSPDLFFFPRWSNDPNGYGLAGMCRGYHANYHGGSSPYELRATMIGVGPSFKSGAVIQHPTGVIDVVPTILHLFGQESREIDGRVLYEALKDGPDHTDVAFDEFTYRSRRQARTYSYEVYANLARVGNTYYLREANGVSSLG